MQLWVWLALVLVVGCSDKAAPRRDAAVVARVADAAVVPLDAPARAAEQVVHDAGWDGTTAASMVAATQEPPVAAADPWGTITLDAPLPRGDAKDAPVAVARGEDPTAMIEAVLDGSGVVIPTDRPVVIKVNLHGFDRMKPGKPDNGIAGRITDPKIVRALIVALQRRGVTDLALADGGADSPAALVKALKLSGYQPILDELGVRFHDLDHWGDGPSPRKLRLPWASYLKDDLIVSHHLVDPETRPFVIVASKIKAHRFAVMTLSIKNLMGAVMIEGAGNEPFKLRWKMHVELAAWLKGWKASKTDDRERYRLASARFSERMADVYGALAPDLAILEGLPAMQGDGFAKVVPYGDGGIVIASRNGCYADFVAAQFFGLDDSDALEAELGARMPPAIAAVAARYFGGVEALKTIVVVGDLDWRRQTRAPAWYRAMAPFELNPM